MNSRFFRDLTISFQWEKNRCTFELQILTGNSNQVVVFNLIDQSDQFCQDKIGQN